MAQTQIIYVDMDDVLSNFSKSHRELSQKHPDVEYPQSLEGFYSGLEPIAGGVEAVNLLRFKPQYDLYILTAPSIYNPLCYSEKRIWIEQHFDLEFTSKLIISPNKGLLKGDFLIDDNIRGKGQENFEGELIHFGSARFPSWKEVLERLS